MPKAKVVTISSNKGGCGKTTTAVQVAAGLARSGRQVLLVDLDKQGHCATFLGRDPAPRLYDLLVKEHPLTELIIEARPQLHLLAGNSETIVAQDFARLRNVQADLLDQTIVERAIGYTYILFDTPPQGLLQECAVYSANLLMVPVPVDYPGMDGAAQFIQVVEHLQKREQLARVPMLILPMFVDTRTNESRHNLDTLRTRFGERVLAPVPYRTRMREAIAEGLTIFEYAPKEDIAEVYQGLAHKVNASLDLASAEGG
ncbi:MAG TPA: ParA family protein [Caldilineaceae bacterium]|nr:ParA family protein [Caldilineaceae bacterium]